jgi:hypothetical protein
MKIFKTVLITMTLSLVGCGAGSGEAASGIDDSINETGNNNSDSISGKIVPVTSNALVNLLNSDGVTVQSKSTDSDGSFEFNGPFDSGDYKINVLHSGLAEHTVGTSKSGGLQATISYESGDSRMIYVTPLSSLVSMTGTSGLEEWLGFDPSSTEPQDSADPFYSNARISNGLLHDLFIKALSVASEILGKRDTQYFYELMLEDLSADEVLDGKGDNAANLSYNGKAITSDVYRTILSESLILAADQNQNQTSFKGLTVGEYAFNLVNKTSSMLLTPGEDLRVGRSAFGYLVNLIDNQTISGNHSLLLTTEYTYKVKTAEIKVNDVTISNGVINSEDIKFDIDTGSLPNSVVDLKFVLALFSGVENYLTIPVNIYNESVFLILKSSEYSNTNMTDFQFELSGQVEDIAYVSIDGNTITPNAGEYRSTLSLNSGSNDIQVNLHYNSGIVENLTATVIVDTEKPSVNEVDHSQVSGYKVPTLNASTNTFEDSLLNIESGRRIGLTAASSSIGFMSISLENMIGYRHAFYQGKIVDSVTNSEDMVAVYSILVNDTVISEDVNLQIDESGLFIIPITVEYFSNQLRSADNNDVFTILLKVSDQAGNITLKDVNFQVSLIE